MKVADHVESALIDWDMGRLDSALTHACIAVDGTARRMFPNLGNRNRYIRCLRHFYWMVEPALGAGIDLEKTTFPEVKIKNGTPPDFAEIVYEVFRCAHAHGDEVPPQFNLIMGGEDSLTWIMGEGTLQFPHTLLFALLFVAVFAPVNKDERPLGNSYLTLGGEPHMSKFIIGDWWGRAADLQPIAQKYNKVRIHIITPEGHKYVKDGPSGQLLIDLTPDTA